MTIDRTRRTDGAPRAGAAVVVALLVVACASPTPTEPASDATASRSPAQTPPTPTSVPTPAVTMPPFACGEPVGRPGAVARAQIAALTATNEAGVGRITFTFRPSGNVAAIPQVEIRPGAPPFTMNPSGLPLAVAGMNFLEITLDGGTALDEDYQPTFAGPFDIAPAGSPIVELRRAGDFEAVSSWVVGLDGPPCVRILPLDGTSRLVIEIKPG